MASAAPDRLRPPGPPCRLGGFTCSAPPSLRPQPTCRLPKRLTNAQQGQYGNLLESFATYGTPLPSLADPKLKDSNEFKPVWEQEAYDEQGRRRLHDAYRRVQLRIPQYELGLTLDREDEKINDSGKAGRHYYAPLDRPLMVLNGVKTNQDRGWGLEYVPEKGVEADMRSSCQPSVTSTPTSHLARFLPDPPSTCISGTEYLGRYSVAGLCPLA